MITDEKRCEHCGRLSVCDEWIGLIIDFRTAVKRRSIIVSGPDQLFVCMGEPQLKEHVTNKPMVVLSPEGAPIAWGKPESSSDGVRERHDWTQIKLLFMPEQEPVFIIRPDMWRVFGKYYFYWFRSNTEIRVNLCSRKCAKFYSAKQHRVIFRESDGMVITPDQRIFDTFAIEHGLDFYLAAFDGDDWQPPELEMRRLLQLDLPGFVATRLAVLMHNLAEFGFDQLVTTAAHKILEIDPEFVMKDAMIANLLCTTADGIVAIDSAYRKCLANTGGSYEALGATAISAWALSIALSSAYWDRARELSQVAYEMDPTGYGVLDNRLAVLQLTGDPGAQSFLDRNAHQLQTQNQFFSAGQIYVQSGLYQKALECFLTADSFWPEIFNKCYIAQLLLDLGKHRQALQQVALGKRCLHQGSGTYTDGNGRVVPYNGLIGEQRVYAEQWLLLIEGEVLCEVGETEEGKKRLRQAIQIAPINPGTRKRLQKYLGESGSSQDLEDAFDLEQQKRIATERELSRARAERQNVAELLVAIANTQENWRTELQTASNALLRDDTDDEESTYILVLANRIRNLQSADYEQHLNECTVVYPALPAKSLEFIATARYLFDTLHDQKSPIYAGVIIELAKAVEYTINEVLIAPYAVERFREMGDARMEKAFSGDRPKTARLISNEGIPKHFMLADLASLCASSDSNWRTHIKLEFGEGAEWLMDRLPEIILEVKDTFRNGCAHQDSATRDKAADLFSYLSQHQVFEHLDAAARVATSC